MNNVFFKKDFYLQFIDGKICGLGGIKKFLSVAVFLLAATFFCVATDYKWNGASSGNWGEAKNWNVIDENGNESASSVCPGAGDSVRFDTEVTITDSVIAGKIVAEKGLVFESDLSAAEIEVKNGNLSVGGNVLVNADVKIECSKVTFEGNLVSRSKDSKKEFVFIINKKRCFDNWRLRF